MLADAQGERHGEKQGARIGWQHFDFTGYPLDFLVTADAKRYQVFWTVVLRQTEWDDVMHLKRSSRSAYCAKRLCFAD
jgi:hypothetical protein